MRRSEGEGRGEAAAVRHPVRNTTSCFFFAFASALSVCFPFFVCLAASQRRCVPATMGERVGNKGWTRASTQTTRGPRPLRGCQGHRLTLRLFSFRHCLPPPVDVASVRALFVFAEGGAWGLVSGACERDRRTPPPDTSSQTRGYTSAHAWLA